MDAVLDLPSVLERLDDDRDLLIELAQIFLEQVPAQLSQIQAAVRSGDAKTLRERAHALKGSAGTLAGSAVSKTAARLEQMGRDGDLSEGQETCAMLDAEVERLVDALQRLIAQETS
jgi:HPt (histidine-containing phosphotransfer) domain-containing protein